MTELRKLSADDGRDVYDLLQEIPKEENGFENNASGKTYEQFREWLAKKEAESRQEGIIDGWKVGSTTYWLYADGIPVGFGKLRHELTEGLRKVGGHIGYGIAPQYRGKGYGKELLRLLLAEARKRGIDRVLITVHADNEASRKVALANSGVITEQTDERLWIWADTKPAVCESLEEKGEKPE